MYKFFPSTFFNFEFIRVLCTTPSLGAEVGECLAAATRIRDGNPESWYAEWSSQAQQAEALAAEASLNGDRAAASWAYLRASNYYRSSAFMLHCNPRDERILAAGRASAAAFDKGAALLDATVQTLKIPYEGDKFLPGRLFVPPPEKRISEKIPIIIVTGGFDSTLEELYHIGVAGALLRGYAVLAFDGPGQGLALRQDKLRMRPDWEQVTGKVLDFLFTRLVPEQPELGLDTSRIAVLGASLGGYLALRAAADPRITACVSCDGCYDLFDVTRSRMPPWFINGWLSGWISDGFFNWTIARLSSSNFQLRWEFGNSMWIYGVDTPADVMRMMQRFSLKEEDGGEYLSRLRCATFITGAADSFYFTPPENAEQIFQKLSHLEPSRKSLWIGHGLEGGGQQAKIGAFALMQQKTFAWLDEQFGIRRKSIDESAT